jgi:hypothetical protein
MVKKDFISKSLNQLECVQAGYTKVNKHINIFAGHITDHNLFLVGDIFLMLIWYDHTLSIGVLQFTTASLSGVTHVLINIRVMKVT